MPCRYCECTIYGVMGHAGEPGNNINTGIQCFFLLYLAAPSETWANIFFLLYMLVRSKYSYSFVSCQVNSFCALKEIEESCWLTLTS